MLNATVAWSLRLKTIGRGTVIKDVLFFLQNAKDGPYITLVHKHTACVLCDELHTS